MTFSIIYTPSKKSDALANDVMHPWNPHNIHSPSFTVIEFEVWMSEAW